MTDTDLAAAVKAAVFEWERSAPLAEREAELAQPATLSTILGLSARQRLTASGRSVSDIRDNILIAPFVHLPGVFDPHVAVDTPRAFIPVPTVGATAQGCAAALAVHGLLGMETISYGTENLGALFVNLVALPGDGEYAKKSKGSMRGHTDGVSFPLNHYDDNNDPRIAPSPDLVTLVGLRNPNNVATNVMPLAAALERLDSSQIAELMKPQYSFRSQQTFTREMQRVLGQELVALDQPVIKQVGDSAHVRYSHSSVVPPSDGGAADSAASAFENACSSCAVPVIIRPGDLLVINNRRALHGRGEVGTEIGGKSRWLLRTYGLETSGLPDRKRHLKGAIRHVLFP